jgi:hypothetical protein
MVANRALPPLVGNLVMGNLVNRDYESTLAQAGDTVNVAIPPTLTANNLAEAGTVQTQNPSLGNAQVVLNTHAEATFTIPDATRVLAVPDLLDTYLRPAVIAIGERIETDLLGLFTLFTANTAQGGTSAMDESRIDASEQALFDAKVPPAEPRFLVVASSPYSAMRQISRFTEFQMTGPTGQPSPMITGALAGGSLAGAVGGTIKGMTVFRSQYVSKVSTTYQNIAFTRNAMALVIRRLPQPIPGTGAIAEYAELGNFGVRVVMSYAPNSLAQQFTVDVLYGVAPLRNNHAVLVKST